MKRRLILFVAAALITGCQTTYKSNGLMGGYSETWYTPETVRVTFRGNGYTSSERAQDFALLRASEIALQHGFAFFAIIDEDNSASVAAYTTPGYANTTANVTGSTSGNVYLNPYGASYSGNSSAVVNSTTTYTPPTTRFFYRPHTGLLIRGFQTKPEGFFSFDAGFLQQSLKTKYSIK